MHGTVLLSSSGFCLLVLIILSIEDTCASPHRDLNAVNEHAPAYNRVRRSADEEAEEEEVQPSDRSEVESTEDQPNIDSLSEEETEFTSSLVPKDEVSEEETKPKNSNKQQKPIPNYTKNYSSSKTASNESFNEKQKPGSYGSQGLKYNSFKKDIKLVLDTNDQIEKANISNSTDLSGYKFEKKKAKLSINTSATNLTKTILPNVKVNETLVMSDQPVEAGSTHNDTDDEDIIDGFSQNTTDIFDDVNITTSADGRTMPPSEGLDFFMISGIVVGTLVFLGLAAGGGFAVYRHRIWNKPQTLSDKCSNADSSGYIDDSTLRENSEEMYSLDNDSFLNSLEAMTIQNYWTDNVKHTKL